MPMPARDLWAKIQEELHGATEAEQLRVVLRHLDGLHDEWKGPYKELRDRLRRMAARLEGHASVRSRAGAHDPYHVKRQGDAQVAVIGAPNAGKSALVAALTGAAAAVADYPFTTQVPLPGMLPVGAAKDGATDGSQRPGGAPTGPEAPKGLRSNPVRAAKDGATDGSQRPGGALTGPEAPQGLRSNPVRAARDPATDGSQRPGGALQLIDTPALVEGASATNRPLLHLLSTMDALAVVVDLSRDPDAQVDTAEAQLAAVGLRPVAGPVATALRLRGKEGVRFRGVALSKDEESAARAVLAQAGLEHAEVFAHTGLDLESLRDQAAGTTPMPTVWLATRAALGDVGRLAARVPGGRPLAVDAADPSSLAGVAEALRTALGLVRVTLLDRGAPDGGGTDLLFPLAGDVALLAAKVGRKAPRGARVWGPSVDRDGLAVGRQHLVADGDRVYLPS